MKTVGTPCPALVRLLTIDRSWGTSQIDDNTAQRSLIPTTAAKVTVFGGDGSFAACHVTHANTTTRSISAGTEAEPVYKFGVAVALFFLNTVWDDVSLAGKPARVGLARSISQRLFSYT